MIELPSWLPPIVCLEDAGGIFEQYIENVYKLFFDDFVAHRPNFRGLPVIIKRDLIEGKERGFWHLTQEGSIEVARTPDIRRCERIGWIRAMIENAESDRLLIWCNLRGQGRRAKRTLIWCPDAEYLVVLENRPGAFILWTAYPVTGKHRKEKLLEEYSRWTE